MALQKNVTQTLIGAWRWIQIKTSEASGRTTVSLHMQGHKQFAAISKLHQLILLFIQSAPVMASCHAFLETSPCEAQKCFFSLLQLSFKHCNLPASTSPQPCMPGHLMSNSSSFLFLPTLSCRVSSLVSVSGAKANLNSCLKMTYRFLWLLVPHLWLVNCFDSTNT